MEIGIIGNGVVGSRIAACFRALNIQTLIYDTDIAKRTHRLNDLITNTTAIFICVPTPTEEKQNLSHIMGTLDAIVDYEGTVIIKSTVLPGTTRELNEIYDFVLLHSAEFLNVTGTISDIVDAPQQIVGCKDRQDISDEIHEMFEKLNNNTIYCSYEESEMTKYCCNVFYAVKNAFFNMIRLACEKTNADFGLVRTLVVNNGWVHPMHTFSPGRDGLRGYGGACLPKEIAAFMKWGEEQNIPVDILAAVRNLNALIRKMPKEDSCTEWESFYYKP